MKNIIKESLLILFLILSSKLYSQQTIYISPEGSDDNIGSIEAPYLTFGKVLNEVRKNNANMQEDIVIYLREGEYFLDETILIDESVSGNNGHHVIFKAYKDEKPKISGGEKITDWSLFEDNIYRAYVGNKSFRQIYIDDSKAIRAREPNICDHYTLDWDTKNKKILMNSQDINGIQNLDTQQPIEVFIQKVFACQILRLAEFDFKNTITPLATSSELEIVESDQSVFVKRKHQLFDGQAYHLENSYQFLDMPNEWFLDKDGYLYVYKDSISSPEEVFIPRLQNLLLIQGTSEKPVKNVTFEGITFEHTNWTLPDSIGLFAGQAIYIYDMQQPKNGGISVEYANNINFKKNVIKHMGGSGISFFEGVQHSRLTANVIKDVAGNGIEVDRRWARSPGNKAVCSNITIDNNLVANIGTDYFSAVGIFVGFADSVVIEHNLLYKLPYAGISVGWGWTLDETNLRNNEIRYNIIDSPLSLLTDGGGIYTLSNQPGTSIHHNLLKNIQRSTWAKEYFASGIYLDQGSNNINVYENIFRNTEKRYHVNSKGEKNTIKLDHKEGKKTVSAAGVRPEYIEILSEMPKDILCYDSYFEDSGKRSEILDMLIYPNPTNDFMNIYDYNLLLSDYISYEIFNIEGKLIDEGSFNKTKYKPFELGVESLSGGVYVLRVTFEGFMGQAKFIKY